MAWNKLSPHATTIKQTKDKLVVRYHSTDIVTAEDNVVTLRNNGHYTATTKKKMNQASAQFKLGFYVYQKDFAWYVRLANGITAQFKEGIQFLPLSFITPNLTYRSQYDY